MKTTILFGLIILAVFLIGCKPITNYEECVAAGHNIIDTLPAQCEANGKTFVEEPIMTEAEARAIAENSECAEQATIKDVTYHDTQNTTWTFSLDPSQAGDCIKTCVVNALNRTAQIKLGCTTPGIGR